MNVNPTVYSGMVCTSWRDDSRDVFGIQVMSVAVTEYSERCATDQITVTKAQNYHTKIGYYSKSPSK
jgi:hypothetical protein